MQRKSPLLFAVPQNKIGFRNCSFRFRTLHHFQNTPDNIEPLPLSIPGFHLTDRPTDPGIDSIRILAKVHSCNEMNSMENFHRAKIHSCSDMDSIEMPYHGFMTGVGCVLQTFNGSQFHFNILTCTYHTDCSSRLIIPNSLGVWTRIGLVTRLNL